MKHSVSFATICRAVLMALSLLISFVSLKLYSSYLTKDIYGTILVASQFMLYLPLFSGGFGMVLFQQMLAAKEQDTTQQLAIYCQVLNSYVCLLALTAALILMAIYSQTSMARHSGLPAGLFLAIALAFMVSFHAGTQFAVLTGLGRQTYSIILSGIGNITAFVILWLGFRAGLGPWAMPFATAAGVVILIPIARILQLRLLPSLPYLSLRRPPGFWNLLNKILPSAMNWLQSQFIIMLLFTVDMMLMGFIYGAAAAALYGIVARVMALSRQVINTLSESMWPNLAAARDSGKKTELMRKVDRLNAWLTGGWFGAIAATLQPFLVWFMKADWVAGSIIIYVAVGRSVVSSLSSPHGYGLLGTGQFRDLAKVVRTELITMAIFVVVLTRFLGPVSIPLASLLGTLGGSFWYMTYMYFKSAEHTVWYKELIAVYIRGIIGGVIAFSVAWAVWHFVAMTFHFQGWAAMGAGGCGLAAALLVGAIAALLRGGPAIQPLGPWLKIPSRW